MHQSYQSSQGHYGDYSNESMYEYDNDGRRPSSRGSKHGLENGGMYSSGGATGSGGYHGYHQGSQHSDFGDEIQGDDDDDMW